MKRLLFTYIVVLFLLVQSGYAQNITFERIRQEDGLPSDITKALVKDSLGFIWVATDDGLAKIEGTNFVKAMSSKPSYKFYKDVLCSKKYGMVAVCDKGIVKITQDYEGIYANDLIDNFTEEIFPRSIFESSDSSLWVADIKKVIHIDREKATSIEFPEKNHTRSYFRSYQFMELGDGRFFILSQKGFLYSYSKEEGSLLEIPWEYSGVEIFASCKLSNNEFLIGCSKGLLKISFSNGLITEVRDFGFHHEVYAIEPLHVNQWIIGTYSSGAYLLVFHEGSFEYQFINGTDGGMGDIVLDNQQQIWLSTGAGLLVGKKTAYNIPFENALVGDVIDIKPYSNEEVCFADKKAVYKANKSSVLSKLYTLSEGEITTIFPTDDALWIGTNAGQLIHKQRNGNIVKHDFSKEGKEIKSLVVDKNSLLWFIQKRNGKTCLLRMDRMGKVKDFTPHSEEEIDLRFLKLSPNKEVYVGAMGFNNYLFKYNYDKNTLDNLSLAISFFNEIPLIHDLVFTKDSACLLATESGILKYKASTIERLKLGKISGEAMTGIALDNMGRIWFGHSTGVICFNGGDLLVYGNSDGIPSKTTSFRCLRFDRDNGFWIGSAAGLTYGKIPAKFNHSLPPIITRVENLGLAINTEGKNKFLQNTMLKVNFASSNYPAQYVEYQYSLNKNNDIDNWEKVEYKQGDLRLDYLDVGKYTLKIKAKNEGHYTWSEPIIYNFRIYKVWYTRLGYIIGINLFLLLSVYLYIYYSRIKSDKEKKRLEEIIEHRTRDLTVQNIELQSAKEETEKAIQTKDRFFSIIAHDLSSPFNTLIGFSRLLVNNRDDFSEEEMKNILSEMLKTSENTHKLLRNLLDWAMSQTGALKIEKRIIGLNGLLNEVLSTLKVTAKQKGIIINLNIPLDTKIFADEALVSTIFRNLISNAIKFSYTNSKITIEIVQDNSITQISVIDSGIGIPEGNLRNIFAVDEKISTQGTNQEKGTGLGLVLCKEFVALNNGEISVHSTPNIGSTFVVKLPSKKV
jgi:signal transduction histidine kinase